MSIDGCDVLRFYALISLLFGFQHSANNFLRRYFFNEFLSLWFLRLFVIFFFVIRWVIVFIKLLFLSLFFTFNIKITFEILLFLLILQWLYLLFLLLFVENLHLFLLNLLLNGLLFFLMGLKLTEYFILLFRFIRRNFPGWLIFWRLIDLILLFFNRNIVLFVFFLDSVFILKPSSLSFCLSIYLPFINTFWPFIFVLFFLSLSFLVFVILFDCVFTY